MDFNIIGIIGSGLMGGGIAQMFAENNIKVILWDISKENLDLGYNKIKKRLEKSVEKQKISEQDRNQILSNISKTLDMKDFNDVSMVIEAAIENIDIKKNIFKELSDLLPKDIILATNTSSLSISEIEKSIVFPERFLCTHFFNPPTKLKLVEISSTQNCKKEIKEQVSEFLKKCGKTPVMVKDSPGFIVNRLLLIMINEAAKMVEEGVASAEDIDTAMMLGALHPAGPLTVADLIGIDTCKHILEILNRGLENDSYSPSQKILDLVKNNNIGRKTKKGFFEY